MEKHVIGVSLGSAERDFQTVIEILGSTVYIERIGTDGDLKKYISLLEKHDGKADAIGLGGLDLWLWCNNKKYAWREPKKLLQNVKLTPVFDGSGLKNSLERLTMKYLQEQNIVDFKKSKTLLVCAIDRFGMAEEIWRQGGPVIYGDFMFCLGIPIPIRSLETLQFLARLLLPVAVQLPIRWLYPVGRSQKSIVPKFKKYYDWADVICGDNHYIRRHMPDNLTGKVIITNTTTDSDINAYRIFGAKLVITTTPSFKGRSPGTNIFEAAIMAALGRNEGQETTAPNYENILRKIGWQPNVVELL